jgi:hypothetical protein
LLKKFLLAVVAVALTLTALAGAASAAPPYDTATPDTGSITGITTTDANTYSVSFAAAHNHCALDNTLVYPGCDWNADATILPTGSTCIAEDPNDGASLGTNIWHFGLVPSLGSTSGDVTFTSAANSFVICLYIGSSQYYANAIRSRLVASTSYTDAFGAVNTLTPSNAAKFSRAGLKKKFGNSYSKGTGKKQKCKLIDRITYRCTVKWSYRNKSGKTKQYKGTTTVTNVVKGQSQSYKVAIKL